MDASLELPVIRVELEGLSKVIIGALAKRYTHPLNALAYQKNEITTLSNFDEWLRSCEYSKLHSGEFDDAKEVPFTIESYPKNSVIEKSPLHPISINLNSELKQAYLEFLVEFCNPGDDHLYATAGNQDIRALQGLSRRIHLGRYVAESKFRKEMARYTSLIQRGDREGITTLLTDEIQEGNVISSVAAVTSQHLPILVAEKIVEFYRHSVIPLTKEVEVRYLLSRLTPIG